MTRLYCAKAIGGASEPDNGGWDILVRIGSQCHVLRRKVTYREACHVLRVLGEGR